MSKRKRTQLPPDCETELDGGFSFPHSPFHAHFQEDEEGRTKLLPYAVDNISEELGITPADHLRGDRANIALLLFLYILQGIPLGLAGAVPMILSSRKVSYSEQAMFSFVYWPFSVKLLWAPIVDAAYLTSFGRRKTWLVPTQYLIGLFMFFLSTKVTSLLGKETQCCLCFLTNLSVELSIIQ